MSFVICYDRGDGHVYTDERQTLVSVMGTLGHLTHDYDLIWVREGPGGPIVLLFDRRGRLPRPNPLTLYQQET